MGNTRKLNGLKLLENPAARLIGAFVILLIAFWVLYYPTIINPERGKVDFIAQDGFAYAQLSEASADAVRSAEFEAAPPGPAMREPGYHALRARFSLEEVPANGLGLLGISTSDNIYHYINGELVAGRGSMELGEIEYRGNVRTIQHVPASALSEGENTLTVVSVIDTKREILLAPPMLADFDDAMKQFQWSEFLQSDLHIVTVTLTLFLAFLFLAVALRSSDRAVTGWLFLLAASWGLNALIPVFISLPLGGVFRLWLYFATFIGLAIAWPAFVNAWSGKPLRFFTPAVLAFNLLVAIVGTFYALSDPDYFTSAFFEDAVNLIGVVWIALTALRILWHFVRNPNEPRHWEGAIMLLILLLGAWHFYYLLFTDDNNYILTRAQPFLIVALALAFFAGRFHLFRSAQQINDELRAKVEVREAELAEAHAREKLLVRDQAFSEERQRIMRDMHDGLGSQLMGMLLAARRGKAEPDRVAEGLQQVVDELRLMIDSMDSVGESLGTALAGFRTRLQPRVEDAGFAFQWDNRLGSEPESYPPRKTLQLFRIMQEAVTNALKHSSGDTIAITLDTFEDESEWLEVTVHDNGSGISGPRRGGHGLDNMRARAVKEGGSVDFASPQDGEGGVVRIRLPIEPSLAGTA